MLTLGACTAPPTVLVTPPPPTATPIIHGSLPISTAAPASTFDRQVIDMLVPHHEASIEMARIALARSQRADVKAFADEVERVQTQEVEDMRAWREMWFGSRQTPSMSQMPALLEPAPVASGTILTVDLAAEVEALRNAPEPFDVAFIDAMERHQQRPLEAAPSPCAARASRSSWISQARSSSPTSAGRASSAISARARSQAAGAESLGEGFWRWMLMWNRRQRPLSQITSTNTLTGVTRPEGWRRSARDTCP